MEEKEYLYIFSHVHKSGGTSINHHIRRNYKQTQYIHIHFNEANCFYNLKSRQYDVLKDNDHLASYLASLSIKKKEQIAVLFGHDVPYGIDANFNKTPKYFTFVRHPVSRIISYFNYSLATIEETNFNPAKDDNDWLRSFFSGNTLMSFTDWVLAVNKNPEILTKQFPSLIDHYCLIFNPVHCGGVSSLDNAKEILTRFYFVGLTEDFKDFLFLYEDIGFTKIYFNHNITAKEYVNKEDANFLIKNCAGFLQDEIKLYEFSIDCNKNFREKNDHYFKKVESCSNRINSWLWDQLKKDLEIMKSKDHLGYRYSL